MSKQFALWADLIHTAVCHVTASSCWVMLTANTQSWMQVCKSQSRRRSQSTCTSVILCSSLQPMTPTAEARVQADCCWSPSSWCSDVCKNVRRSARRLPEATFTKTSVFTTCPNMQTKRRLTFAAFYSLNLEFLLKHVKSGLCSSENKKVNPTFKAAAVSCKLDSLKELRK